MQDSYSISCFRYTSTPVVLVFLAASDGDYYLLVQCSNILSRCSIQIFCFVLFLAWLLVATSNLVSGVNLANTLSVSTPRWSKSPCTLVHKSGLIDGRFIEHLTPRFLQDQKQFFKTSRENNRADTDAIDRCHLRTAVARKYNSIRSRNGQIINEVLPVTLEIEVLWCLVMTHIDACRCCLFS